MPGLDRPLDVSELTQAATAIAAQQEQEALDAILADLNDVDADVGRVHIHAPKHMLVDDSPDAAKARSDLVAYLFHKLHQPMGALVDVSVTQFAVARARKHHQQDAELEGPQAGTYPMLTMVFASRQAATEFMPKDPNGRTFDWACTAIDDARLGVDTSKQLYYAIDGKEMHIPDLTEVLMKVDGKVIRAFISNPSAQLIKFMSDAKHKAHEMVGKLLQHFWKTQGPVPVLQIRTNYTITTYKVSGKALYVPSGMYFDILMKEIPPFWPSNFPASHGNLRWFVTGAKVTDFAKTQAPTKQPAGRFHSALANWFKASSHTTLPALAAPGEIPPQSAAALAMPRSRRGGERGARQR